jgi:hypothetical protein
MKIYFLLFLLLPSLSFSAYWQCINRNKVITTCNTWRMKVPRGWIVSVDNDDRGASVTFVPDEDHEWDA